MKAEAKKVVKEVQQSKDTVKANKKIDKKTLQVLRGGEGGPPRHSAY